MTKFACIGDYNSAVTAHQAIPKALELAGQLLNETIEYQWIDTVDITADSVDHLKSFDGMWVVPASPYQNMDGALLAIRTARENNIPFMGTCGGYQHAILEFARNEMGYANAENAEVVPDAEFPLIAPLTCALVELDGQIKLQAGSLALDLYGSETITEQYRCSYGFNVAYLDLFAQTNLKVTGFDLDDDPRIFELQGHRFFVGTAYQPERSALAGNNHPLITEFVRVASETR